MTLQSFYEFAAQEEPAPVPAVDDPDLWDADDWTARIEAHLELIGKADSDRAWLGLLRLITADVVTIDSSGELLVRKPKSLEMISLETLLYQS